MKRILRMMMKTGLLLEVRMLIKKKMTTASMEAAAQISNKLTAISTDSQVILTWKIMNDMMGNMTIKMMVTINMIPSTKSSTRQPTVMTERVPTTRPKEIKQSAPVAPLSHRYHATTIQKFKTDSSPSAASKLVPSPTSTSAWSQHQHHHQ